MLEAQLDANPAPGPGAGRAGALTAICVALFVVLGAFWIVGSFDLQFASSDTLVPVFTSLYRWTPFFWGENSFGMAIPLLATPIRNPVANLVAQKAIGHALGLLFPFLLARWLAGRRRWFAAGALGTATLIAVLGPYSVHLFFVAQCYIASATVAVAGAILLDSERRVRRIAGSLLLAIAFWITPSTLLWLAPMMLLQGLVRFDGRGPAPRGLPAALAVRLGLVAGLAFLLAWSGRLSPGVRATPLGLAPPSEWPATWGALARGTLAHLPAGWIFLLAALAIALVLVRAPRRSPEALAPARFLVGALGLGALAQLLGAGIFSWVAQARLAPTGWRFAIPSIVFALLAPPFAASALWPVAAGVRRSFGGIRPWRGLALLALPLLALALRFGAPSPARAREALEWNARAGLHLDPFARELVERHATHLLAPYSLAYPIAFRANCRLHAAGEPLLVWPLAERAEAARDLWEPADWSASRIAVLRELPPAQGIARAPVFDLETDRRAMHLPELELVERGDFFDFYRGRDKSPAK